MRYLYYATCLACMYGLFEFVRFMITGINHWFGHGFAAGVAVATIIFYFGTRAEGGVAGRGGEG